MYAPLFSSKYTRSVCLLCHLPVLVQYGWELPSPVQDLFVFVVDRHCSKCQIDRRPFGWKNHLPVSMFIVDAYCRPQNC